VPQFNSACGWDGLPCCRRALVRQGDGGPVTGEVQRRAGTP